MYNERIFCAKEIKQPVEWFDFYFPLTALPLHLLIYSPNFAEKHHLFLALTVD